MSHFLQINCFLKISVWKQPVCGSTHALVGNYSQLNPKDCGITRFVPNLDYSCFKWHKNMTGAMKGRNATEEEVPWIVYIERRFFFQLFPLGKCTGSLIGDQWILTSAHCINSDDPDDYYIYAGIHSFHYPNKTYLARATQIFKYPDYSPIFKSPFTPPINDIALIKLDRLISSIKTIEGNKHFNCFKSICLPKNNIFNTEQEFALFGGWGHVDRDEWSLQVGIRKVYPSDDYSFWPTHNYITNEKLENQVKCQGDSGGPFWQYYMGRAVLIGIDSHGMTDDKTSCEPLTPYYKGFKSISWGVRVSKYIDWIKNITELN